jgi:hypothetical protein
VKLDVRQTGRRTMAGIPCAEEIQTTYENFTARCPWCGFKNIFNRASDLEDLEPIAHKQVVCLNRDCEQRFTISGDSINPAFEMLIYDCYELRCAKHYAYCILNLAQAFEVFFSQYLRVELLYRPFALDSDRDIEQLNDLVELLYEKVKRHASAAMRNLFFYQVLQQRQARSLSEAEASINALPDRPPEPSDASIESVTDQRLSALLMRLKYCKVGELRNQVVHKRAYRPKLDEVNEALRETREILLPLASMLRIQSDDLNWYMRSA